MCCCTPSGERARSVGLRSSRRGAGRGFTLLETMVSQVILLIFITSLASLVVVLTRKANGEASVTEAQARLREATQLLLRDCQGLGGAVSSAGDTVEIRDGGTNGPDSFVLFRRDESVCAGGVKIASTTGSAWTVETVDVDVTAAVDARCPIGRSNCVASEIAQRAALIQGPVRSAVVNGQAAGGGCSVEFPPTAERADALAAYNLRFGESATSFQQMLNDLSATELLFGSSFTYRLNGDVLQRSTDDGKIFTDVLDGVFDLQVERVYDDGGVIRTFAGSTGAALPTGVTDDDFIGLRIGVITFGRSPDGLTVPPPNPFSNRNHVSVPMPRRYRASFMFAAARNRPDL